MAVRRAPGHVLACTVVGWVPGTRTVTWGWVGSPGHARSPTAVGQAPGHTWSRPWAWSLGHVPASTVVGWVPGDTHSHLWGGLGPRGHAQSWAAVSLVLENWPPATAGVVGQPPLPESSPLALALEKQGSEWQLRHL